MRLARSCVDDGRSVLLRGPAGVGKTTTMRAVTHGIPHLVGQCLPLLSTVEHHPLSHAVRTSLQGPAADVAADVSSLLDGRVLVIEDAHWADPASLEVLALLKGRVRLLLTSRTGLDVALQLLTTIEIPPLDRRSARALARRIHPHLDDAARDRLVSVAHGNPLLIKALVTRDAVSPTLVDAMTSRLSELADEDLDVLARLALFGRPAAAAIIGWSADAHDAGLLVDHDDGLWFEHALIADALLALMDPERRVRLHGDLASRCGDADAARHHLLAGNPSKAAEAAIRAARSATPASRASLLALAVNSQGDRASSRLRLDAAAAFIEAHRPSQADEMAASVVEDDVEVRAESALYRSQAAWLLGDVERAVRLRDDGLDLVNGSHSPIEAMLLVERAAQVVRLRFGDPAIVSVASDALAVANRAAVGRARARNTMGLALAHTGQRGWEECYQQAAVIARAEGNVEEECAAMFWMVSAYGFFGPLRRAISLGSEMLERTEQLGLRRWHSHFLGASTVHRLGTGNGDADLLERARRFLLDDPLFRNRPQVDMALATGLVDVGDLDGARAVLAEGRRHVRNPEGVSLLAVADAEIGLTSGVVEDLVAALEELATCERRFFGMGAAAESAAVHCVLQTGSAIEIPRLGSPLQPTLDVVDLERAALDDWLSGRARLASKQLAAAATEWSRRGFLRFSARAWYSASEVARAGGMELEAERALAEAATLCRRVQLEPVAALVRTRYDDRHRRRVQSLLTAREIEILSMVASGDTSPTIAAQLHISRTTVNTHIEAARLKLGAATRTQAAAMVGQVVP